jgi:hypothetical protein
MDTAHKVALIIAILVGFFLYIQLLCLIISWWSGWRPLVARFRHDFDFRNQIGRWQSARMRWGCHYNNALKIAADETGMYLSTTAIVPQHPPLLIPWNEIKVIKRSTFWMWTFVSLELGTTERIPFMIQEKLFTRINQPGRLETSNLW